jgi:SAM-dependent methyltransferase
MSPSQSVKRLTMMTHMGKSDSGVCRLAGTLRRRFWSGPLGHGKTVPVAKWEEEYRSGAWDYLEGVQELAHYMVIVGYIRHALHLPKVLDVGCGHGRLLRLFPLGTFSSYLGIDFSLEAIALANRFATSEATFLVADFETWIPPHPFDAIIFNESAYHGRRPVELVKRYSDHLTPGGKIIISMFKAPGERATWKKIGSVLHQLDGLCIKHDCRHEWRLGLFEPKHK